MVGEKENTENENKWKSEFIVKENHVESPLICSDFALKLGAVLDSKRLHRTFIT